MAFRQIDVNLMLKGTVLAIVEKIFPEGTPSLREYAGETGVAASTFRRAAEWLLGLLPGLLSRRRPGPAEDEEAASGEREEAVRKLQDLWAWLEKNRRKTDKNSCFTPEAKQRIAAVSEEIQSSGVMSFEEIAAQLGIDPRQLLRIRAEVKKAGGEPPEEKSRRPQKTEELAPEIQDLIARVEVSADSRNPYGPTDIKRILEKNYKEDLRRYHGWETIAVNTVKKYMGREPKEKDTYEHPRGAYNYPEPFQQVAIDTSHLKLFGVTFYIITVFEMGGRLNLLTRVFLRERIEEALAALEEYLEKFPAVEVTVIDRGTPYLNAQVKAVLEERGKLRVVCRSRTPTEKAALERHFLTMKAAIRPALREVFPENPGWDREKIAKLLEVAAAVFKRLYHQIPQEGIDGKSPAERIEAFDPVRASALMVELFRRSVDSQPGAEYAGEIHRLFQLPGSEEETVKRLGQFGAKTLRRVVKEVAPYMGPPQPGWMYDPLGYLEVKAREISKQKKDAFYKKRREEENAKREREEKKRRKEELEAEAGEMREHPERFVEEDLRLLVKFIESRFEAGVKSMRRRVGELLRNLSQNLKGAFSFEIERLKKRIRTFSKDSQVLLEAERILEDFSMALGP